MYKLLLLDHFNSKESSPLPADDVNSRGRYVKKPPFIGLCEARRLEMEARSLWMKILISGQMFGISGRETMELPNQRNWTPSKATVAAILVVILMVVGNSPLARLQHKYLKNFMVARDLRLKGQGYYRGSDKHENTEVVWLGNTLPKSYKRIEERRSKMVIHYSKSKWLLPSSLLVISYRNYNSYFLGLLSHEYSSRYQHRVYISCNSPYCPRAYQVIPDVAGVFIGAKVALTRIVKFLEEPELHKRSTKDLNVKPGEKVAICGEVGSGKSTLLDAILGEVSSTKGMQ
ncbi:hypothetical protein ACET3Z_028036 [Daucus carota]